MVYADPFHNYCVALVVPAHQALEQWAQNSGINYKNFDELCHNDQAIKEVQQSLSKVRLELITSMYHYISMILHFSWRVVCLIYQLSIARI